jgi:ribosomal protein L24E
MPQKSNYDFTPLHYDEYGLHHYDNRVTRKCPYCKQEYTRGASEVEWKSDFNKLIFCSYNCRSKYYKTHQLEREKYKESHALYAKHDKFVETQKRYDKKKWAEQKKLKSLDKVN